MENGSRELIGKKKTEQKHKWNIIESPCHKHTVYTGCVLLSQEPFFRRSAAQNDNIIWLGVYVFIFHAANACEKFQKREKTSTKYKMIDNGKNGKVRMESWI